MVCWAACLQELQLPIQSSGALVPNAFLTLTNLLQTPGHASAIAAAAAAAIMDHSPKVAYDVFVRCRNLRRSPAAAAGAGTLSQSRVDSCGNLLDPGLVAFAEVSIGLVFLSESSAGVRT